MTSLRFNYRWAIAVIAVAAITLTLSLYPATKARPLARAAADLEAEKQALISFTDSLSSLEKKVFELQKKIRKKNILYFAFLFMPVQSTELLLPSDAAGQLLWSSSSYGCRASKAQANKAFVQIHKKSNVLYILL